MPYLIALTFILVVGAAAIGCIINGSPNNMAAAAIFLIAIVEVVRPMWRSRR